LRIISTARLLVISIFIKVDRKRIKVRRRRRSTLAEPAGSWTDGSHPLLRATVTVAPTVIFITSAMVTTVCCMSFAIAETLIVARRVCVRTDVITTRVADRARFEFFRLAVVAHSLADVLVPARVAMPTIFVVVAVLIPVDTVSFAIAMTLIVARRIPTRADVITTCVAQICWTREARRDVQFSKRFELCFNANRMLFIHAPVVDTFKAGMAFVVVPTFVADTFTVLVALLVVVATLLVTNAFVGEPPSR